jgi:NDP-sugar pyrophosphorylase family protein
MPSLSHVTALILVGGAGTRLRAVVYDRPKPLAEVAGRPFLAYLLDQIADAGVRRGVLCTGFRAEQVTATFGERHGALELMYSPETEPRGTGGALASALPLATGDAVLAMNGDSYCDVDLNAFWRAHVERNANASVLVTRVENASAFGTVRLAPDGQILAFLEKSPTTAPGWVNAGVYAIRRSLLEAIPQTGSVSLERDVFPKWLTRRFYGFPTDGALYDIGTPESYAFAQRIFAERRQREITASRSAES